jgi:hypothetical protein
MSFNRLKYDIGVKNLDDKISTRVGNYGINTPVLKNNCFQTNPRINSQKTGVSMDNNVDWRFYAGPIDTESDLLNLNRRASRDPSTKYNPINDMCKNSDKCLSNMPDCHFVTSDTRLSNPSSNLRGINIPRFDYLNKNPQNNVFFQGHQNMSTRNTVKDAWITQKPVPSINTMTPKPRNAQDMTKIPTHALYQYDKCG